MAEGHLVAVCADCHRFKAVYDNHPTCRHCFVPLTPCSEAVRCQYCATWTPDMFESRVERRASRVSASSASPLPFPLSGTTTKKTSDGHSHSSSFEGWSKEELNKLLLSPKIFDSATTPFLDGSSKGASTTKGRSHASVRRGDSGRQPKSARKSKDISSSKTHSGPQLTGLPVGLAGATSSNTQQKKEASASLAAPPPPKPTAKPRASRKRASSGGNAPPGKKKTSVMEAQFSVMQAKFTDLSALLQKCLSQQGAVSPAAVSVASTSVGRGVIAPCRVPG